jgi:hypothetical protein
MNNRILFFTLKSHLITFSSIKIYKKEIFKQAIYRKWNLKNAIEEKSIEYKKEILLKKH